MRRFHSWWKVRVILGAISIVSVAFGISHFALTAEARGRDEQPPYVPEIIEIQKDHAWCYVLTNAQNKLVGDIHIMSCVPIFQRR